MMKKVSIFKIASLIAFTGVISSFDLHAHCQMPCGIYHDDMVYDLIDQYVETMIKAVTILNQNKFETPRQRNEFVRWVMEKEKESDKTAELIMTYFLQQKIMPSENETGKRVESAHQLLALLVTIKQNADVKIVQQFANEWEKFKLMFHVEGYECKVEQLKMKKRQEQLKKIEAYHHDHDHEKSHDP